MTIVSDINFSFRLPVKTSNNICVLYKKPYSLCQFSFISQNNISFLWAFGVGWKIAKDYGSSLGDTRARTYTNNYKEKNLR